MSALIPARVLLYGISGDGPLREHGLPSDCVGMVPRAGGIRGRMSTLMAAPEFCRPGSARRTSTSTRASSAAPGSAAG